MDKKLFAFEIVVDVLDSRGKPTGKRKYFANDSAYKIWEFYARHVGSIQHKKKITKNNPNADEAAKILEEIFPTNYIAPIEVK